MGEADEKQQQDWEEEEEGEKGQVEKGLGKNVNSGFKQSSTFPLTNDTTSRLSPELIMEMKLASLKAEVDEEAKILDKISTTTLPCPLFNIVDWLFPL